jgi:hypothetical protein
MKYLSHLVVSICLILTFCGGCSSPTSALLDGDSQVELRSIQSRRFDTNDKEMALRTAMATLQDLGFVVDAADVTLGSVSATKLNQYAVRMTVTVRPYGEGQVVVRANAQYNLKAIEDPQPYQQFFDAYAKALFLTAQNI